MRYLIIFKRINLQITQYIANNIPNQLYITLENSQTLNQIRVTQLEQIFLPKTAPDNSRYYILILNSYSSYVSIDFLQVCKQNKVKPIFLPTHSSHVLQPLNLSCFSLVKSKYYQLIINLLALNNLALIKKACFITAYHHAREEGLIERVIQSGWRVSRISPQDPNKAINLLQVKQKLKTPPRLKRTLSVNQELLQTLQKPQDIF